MGYQTWLKDQQEVEQLSIHFLGVIPKENKKQEVDTQEELEYMSPGQHCILM